MGRGETIIVGCNVLITEGEPEVINRFPCEVISLLSRKIAGFRLDRPLEWRLGAAGKELRGDGQRSGP